MAQLQLTSDDKLKRWGSGPWIDEPDRIEFEAHGLPCLMLRNPFGAWCGYAAVPPGHPYHGKSDADVEAHGGITYAGTCDESVGICHVPKPGEPDNVYWFGFDCSHCYDLTPGLRIPMLDHVVYRDVNYVRAEVEALAAQLAAAR
jgi:hypothetical protein